MIIELFFSVQNKRKHKIGIHDVYFKFLTETECKLYNNIECTSTKPKSHHENNLIKKFECLKVCSKLNSVMSQHKL